MEINDALFHVEKMCTYAKDFTALETIRAALAEALKPSHNRPSTPVTPETPNIVEGLDG